MLLIIGNYAILALTFVLARCSVLVAQPLFVITIRMILAGIFLLGYACATRSIHLTRRDSGDLLQVTLFHIYIPFVLEFWALQYMPSAKMNLLYTLTPFISGIFSYVLLRERFSHRKICALVLGGLSVIPILSRDASWWSSISSWNYSIPEFVALIAVCSATYAWFVIKRLLDAGHTSASINGIAMLGGGILAGISCLVSMPSDMPLVSSWAAFWWTIVLLIVLANGVFYNLQTYLIHRYGINTIMFAGCLSPLFGAFFGWILLGEHLTWHFALSAALMSVALGLYYRK